MRSQASGGPTARRRRDERGAVNHDLGASEIGGNHRIEVAPDRLGTDSADLLVAGR